MHAIPDTDSEALPVTLTTHGSPNLSILRLVLTIEADVLCVPAARRRDFGGKRQ